MPLNPSPVYTPIPRSSPIEGVMMGSIFKEENIAQIKDFDLEPEDVLMCGYPKSGTTWLQEIVWLLSNEMNFEKANSQSVWSRTPLIESAPPKEPSGLEIVRDQPHPRLIKTHLPLKYWKRQIEDAKPKVIVMMRNVKDVLVSFYHFIQLGHGEACCSWDQFFDNFRLGKCLYGSWFDQVHEYWTAYKDSPNVLFLHFEKMKADPRVAALEVAGFLGRDVSEEELTALLDHTSFKKMKANPATNLQQHEYLKAGDKTKSFQRKGAIGDWRSTMSEEQSQYLDELMEKTFKDTGLEFQFE